MPKHAGTDLMLVSSFTGCFGRIRRLIKLRRCRETYLLQMREGKGKGRAAAATTVVVIVVMERGKGLAS
jgi:hypothetical protein